QLGQDALASADAYADQRFAARVVYINPGVDAQRGSVEVKLAVPQPPAYLKQDMTISVDIEVARRTAALLVPTEAVRDIDSRSPWVLKIDGGRARRQAVAIGLRSRGWCEITGGLNAGERVVTEAGADVAALADGARVRPLERSRS
ncbi:MAG TPA: efflux RND transporter periplasmic adaptor subunit, partial [Ramlibacter sp.]